MTRSLSIYIHNMRSFDNKLAHFQPFVYSTDPFICAITETWLTNDTFNCEFSLFTLFRKDKETRGGGALIACANSLPTIPAPPYAPPHIEYVSVKINTSSYQYFTSSLQLPNHTFQISYIMCKSCTRHTTFLFMQLVILTAMTWTGQHSPLPTINQPNYVTYCLTTTCCN